MAARLIWSYAPIPSTDRMVRWGSAPVVIWRVWTKASVPARVERAYWKRWHLASKAGAKCCAKLRATNLRRKSLTTSPRTPPEAFWRATMRPKPMAAAMEGGIVAAASLWQARWKASAATGSSSRTLAISAVRPLGPGAVPLRALARLHQKSWDGSCNGEPGVNCRMAGSNGWYGCCGLALGSVSWSKVLVSPGAKGSARSAYLARDNSPRRVSLVARLDLCSAVGW